MRCVGIALRVKPYRIPTAALILAESDARFNRMFFVVSSTNPEIRKFLTDHGCGPF
jgi:hypothetical protein